jgi:hypothetical protein
MEPGRDQLRLTVIAPIAEVVDPAESLYLTLPADYALETRTGLISLIERRLPRYVAGNVLGLPGRVATEAC